MKLQNAQHSNHLTKIGSSGYFELEIPRKDKKVIRKIDSIPKSSDIELSTSSEHHINIYFL